MFFNKNRILTFPFKHTLKFFSEKFYKVTFSGLDKFISNEDFRNILDNINEVKVHRSNKSTNKNYAHVDLSSTLNITSLREKFESVKIMGKTVKVRVKELDEETKNLLSKSYNNFEFMHLSNREEAISYVKEYMKMFYLKNLTDNPHQIKSLLDQVGKNTDWMKIYNYNRQLFEFEYKLQILKDFDDRRFTRKDLLNNPTFLAIRNFSNFSEKHEKSNLIIKNIHEIFEKIFQKLGYPSFDIMNNKGVYRNLQIKILNTDEKEENCFYPKFMVTLMLSMSELSQVDLKILSEAIKYEFKLYANQIIFYLSINEKVQSLVQNSSIFYLISGNQPYLEYACNASNSNQNKIKIFPVSSDTLPLYLSKIDFKEIFGKSEFSNVYELDFSMNYVPNSTLMNISVENKIYFLRHKIEFGIYDMQTREDLLESKNLFTSDNNKLEVVANFDDYVKLINGINGKEQTANLDCGINSANSSYITDDKQNLLIINLRDLSSKKFKFDKIRDNAKYHVIISHSYSQILDFLKNYQTMPNLKKMVFVSDNLFEYKEIVVLLEK